MDDAVREVVVRRGARPVIDAKWLRRSGEAAYASLYCFTTTAMSVWSRFTSSQGVARDEARPQQRLRIVGWTPLEFPRRPTGSRVTPQRERPQAPRAWSSCRPRSRRRRAAPRDLGGSCKSVAVAVPRTICPTLALRRRADLRAARPLDGELRRLPRELQRAFLVALPAFIVALHAPETREPHAMRSQADGARGTRTPDLLGAIQAARRLNSTALQAFPQSRGRSAGPKLIRILRHFAGVSARDGPHVATNSMPH